MIKQLAELGVLASDESPYGGPIRIKEQDWSSFASIYITVVKKAGDRSRVGRLPEGYSGYGRIPEQD